MWTSENAFVYPPRCLWRPLESGLVSREWARAAEGRSSRDPLGLYVHLPADACAAASRASAYLDCLRREAEALALPRKLPARTLYIGSGGSGALSRLPAAGIDALLSWLRGRFKLEALEQTTVELDASALCRAGARALARNGVDRVAALVPRHDGTTASSLRRQAFAEGIRLCRDLRIRTVSLDVALNGTGRDAAAAEGDVEFALSLEPDAVCLFGEGDEETSRRLRARVEDSLRRGGRRIVERDNNLQLAHALRLHASVLGLGWGAVSHVRGRLVYGKSSSLERYEEVLLRGEAPALSGSRLSEADERRSLLIHHLEDTGVLDSGTFRRAFGMDPEEAFPRELRALLAGRRLSREGGLLRLAVPWEDRFSATFRLYGERVLGGLVRRIARGASLDTLCLPPREAP